MKDKVINLRIKPEDYKIIKEYASKNGDMSVSAFLRMSAIYYIKNREKALRIENNDSQGVKE